MFPKVGRDLQFQLVAQPQSQRRESIASLVKSLSRRLKQEANSFYEAAKLQSELTWWGDSNYPAAFYDLSQPPYLLFYRGSACWKSNRSLAVVGSREPEKELLNWMEVELASALKCRAPVVVSGGARGVDQKAHQLCLRLGLPTLVLLPSSLDHFYPPQLKDWESSVIQLGGAFLSEYAPGKAMRKQYFLQRNRLIAAIGSHCLVLQAKRKSGTMLTAQWAIELHRELATLPHAPWSGRASGSNDILASGGQMIRDRADLITWLRFDDKATKPQFQQKVD